MSNRRRAAGSILAAQPVCNGLALLQTRLELLSIEAQEERVRLLALLTYGALAFVLLSFA